jgi:hypothetical protein
MGESLDWMEIIKNDIEETKRLEQKHNKLLVKVEEMKKKVKTDEERIKLDILIDDINKEIDKVIQINNNQSELLNNCKE